MSSILRRRPSPAMAVALVALFLSLGGVSYGLAAGSIGSREIRNNSVRTQDIRNRTITHRDVSRDGLGGTNIKESRLGKVPSAASADNAANASSLGGVAAGQYVQRLWAAVNATGTLARGAGVTSTALVTNPGRYQVVFNRDVTGCSYVAGGGNPTTGTPAQTVAVTAQRAGNANAVFVATRNDVNAFLNRSFYLQVIC